MQITAAEQAYRTLKTMIVSLELKPGVSLGEKHVCEMLGASRTPIREAFVRLGSEGLVESRGRAGTLVAPISREAVQAAQFVRQSVEMRIVERAARSGDRASTFRADQALDEQRFAIEEQDAEHFFRADEELHQTFCRAAGRTAVWPVIAEAKKHLDRLRRLSLSVTDFDRLYQDHVEIIDAVKQGDGERASRVMGIHLTRIMKDVDLLEQRYPEYFKVDDADVRHSLRNTTA